MGYYSDTAIVVEKKDFLRLIEECKEKREDVLHLLNQSRIKRHHETISLNWKCIKWYQDFPEVSYIEDFIKKCPHYKIHFGEEIDDCEEDFEGDNQDFWDAAYPVRRIETTGEEIKLSSFLGPTNWIIGVGGCDCVTSYRVKGTKEQVKKHLFALITQAREEAEANGKCCDTGTDSVDKIEETYEGHLCGFACFDDYHLDFEATPEMPVKQL